MGKVSRNLVKLDGTLVEIVVGAAGNVLTRTVVLRMRAKGKSWICEEMSVIGIMR